MRSNKLLSESDISGKVPETFSHSPVGLVEKHEQDININEGGFYCLKYGGKTYSMIHKRILAMLVFLKPFQCKDLNITIFYDYLS